MARNRKISTEIAGQRVDVEVKFYPSPDNPNNLQWSADVPIKDLDDNDKRVVVKTRRVRGYCNVKDADKYQWLLKETDETQEDFVLSRVTKQHEKQQARYDNRFNRELEAVEEELGKRDERLARKSELEAKITVRKKALRQKRKGEVR